MMVKKEGTPSTKLGPMMGMEPTSLSRTLKLMENEGFILRKESEKDKRQVLIFLTEKGLEKRRIIRSSLLSFNEELESTPESVNSDPYGAGWMIKVKVSDLGELDLLLSSESYKDLIGA